MTQSDLFSASATIPAIVPSRKLHGRLVATLATDGADDFVTAAVPALDLTLEGIPGDRHFGFVRKSGSREPWYPRGTPIRSRRQLSILSVAELADIAAALGIPAASAEALGGNLVVEGIAALSFLPAGTRLHFESGAVVLVEHRNRPCRHAGAALAREHPGDERLEFDFVTVARNFRGLLASVEHPGIVAPGDVFEAVVPEQWLYGPMS